ncbi:hypothetical protein AJ78_05015 [Emergomyces pasteurianus Ep9510]|uniref:Uncharacterized protein n=1 Tax=Emergomyces pasteurianus Ep9510 TaxID=1447872 RepID=A0A1J9PF94_9EURO|nr:hypothetical protein AJ78_05015 [Emergomyces pasteurianus Ep9510]
MGLHYDGLTENFNCIIWDIILYSIAFVDECATAQDEAAAGRKTSLARWCRNYYCGLLLSSNNYNNTRKAKMLNKTREHNKDLETPVSQASQQTVTTAAGTTQNAGGSGAGCGQPSARATMLCHAPYTCIKGRDDMLFLWHANE